MRRLRVKNPLGSQARWSHSGGELTCERIEVKLTRRGRGALVPREEITLPAKNITPPWHLELGVLFKKAAPNLILGLNGVYSLVLYAFIY